MPSTTETYRRGLPRVNGARCVLMLAAGLVLATIPVGARAGVYSYTDESGVLHVTNKKPVQDGSFGKTNAEAAPLKQTKLPGPGKLSPSRAGYDKLIREAAAYYSLPEALIKAVIAAESAFEPTAVSSAGAMGLMQLHPQTASAMAVSNSFDPKENIFGGTRYLRFMLNRFQGDVSLAAAAYNAGPSAVEKAGGIPPFKETRAYVSRVLKLYEWYRNR